MSKGLVYVVRPYYGVDRCFAENGFNLTTNIDDAEIIVWTGGEDINPEIYGHTRHNTTWFNPSRDRVELAAWEHVKDTNKMKVGICRGHQLLSALNGAILFQDVDNHCQGSVGHSCVYSNENAELEISSVSSVHHQMVDPRTSSKPYEVWAWTNRSNRREYGSPKMTDDRNINDVEMIWWPESRSFGFQGHPEYSNRECTDLFFRALERARAI